MRGYRIDLTRDDNGTYLVTCAALPEVTTFGETEEACALNARNAVEEALAARIARGAAIPVENYDDEVMQPSRWLAMRPLPELKIELYQALQRTGITRAELARRLAWNRNSVDRLFQLDHESRLEQIETAAQALGMSVQARLVERQPARERHPA
jgi:antitoxin HicB